VVSREQVFTALYALLLTADYPFEIQNTNGRYMQAWDVPQPSAIQPALYLQEGSQRYARPNGDGGLVEKTYEAKVWIYFRRDGSAIPATIYNEVLDAVEQVIIPQGPKVPQTLAAQNNGVRLVTNVRMVSAMWDEGFLDPLGGQAIILVNLEVLTSN
jgi:hypothetical protein